jgi:arginyl-tRNA synthetase
MRDIVVDLIVRETGLDKKEVENLVEIPPQQELGDFAFPCFSLAKIEKKSPLLIAENLVEKFRKNLPKEITNVDFKSAYVNFFIDKKVFAEKVLKKKLEVKLDEKKIGIILGVK